jgi:putative transport protein
MKWLADVLREHPELALFVALAIGHALGRLRLGSFQLGSVLGTLIAGVLLGQLGAVAAPELQTMFFLLFLFAIGFRTGPEFFQALRSSAGPQIVLTIVLCATGVGATWALSRALAFDGGTAAGLLSGALTSSTALGTATAAASSLDPTVGTRLANNVATAYAITYFLGTFLVVWFLPVVGPRLMRVDLHDVCRKLELEMGLVEKDPTVGSAYSEIIFRAYRLPAEYAGRTALELEGLWPSEHRATIGRLRRGDSLVAATPEMRLETGDIVAVSGAQRTLLDASNPLREEVLDPELLDIPVVSAELVLTHRRIAGMALEDIAREIGSRNVYLLKMKRGGRDLPFTPRTVLQRGDVMTVTGTQTDVARVAAGAGFVAYATPETDLLLVTTAIAAGILVGLPTVTLGRIAIGLSTPVGVLLAGLVLGQLRSVNPRFGRIPEAAVWLFESLGLTGFLALVGMSAGPGLMAGLRSSGLALVACGVVVTLLPHVVTILIGRYAFKMNPGILLGVCAGAGTSGPALAELEKAARSQIPTLGYGMACAIGNVLLAISGTMLVLLLGG